MIITHIILEMQKIKRIVSLWLPVGIWALVIFTFSSLPTVETTNFYLGDFLIKKSAHLIEYGIFATLVYRALFNSKVSIKKAMYISVIAAFVYGASDEFHQSFTPGRGPKFTDVLIDTTGASIFIYGVIGNMKKMPLLFRFLYMKLGIKDTL